MKEPRAQVVASPSAGYSPPNNSRQQKEPLYAAPLPEQAELRATESSQRAEPQRYTKENRAPQVPATTTHAPVIGHFAAPIFTYPTPASIAAAALLHHHWPPIVGHLRLAGVILLAQSIVFFVIFCMSMLSMLPMAVLTLVAGVCCLIGMRRLATYIDTITQLQNHQVASQDEPAPRVEVDWAELEGCSTLCVLLKASTVLLGMSVVLGLVSISLVLETEPTNYYAVLAFFLCLMIGGCIYGAVVCWKGATRLESYRLILRSQYAATYGNTRLHSGATTPQLPEASLLPKHAGLEMVTTPGGAKDEIV